MNNFWLKQGQAVNVLPAQHSKGGLTRDDSPWLFFSARHHSNIVATLFRMAGTLFQHCYAVLRNKSSLRIVPCNITLTLFANVVCALYNWMYNVLLLQDVYCKYSMYLEDDIKTKVISGTRNPEFNYERRFTFEQCTPKVMILHPDMNDWYFEETKVTICSLQIPGHINLLVAVGNFRERLEQLFCRPFSLSH